VVDVECRHPLEPDPTGEASVQEKIGIAPPGQNPALPQILESNRQEVRADGKGNGKIDVEPKVLAVDPGDGTAVQPDVSEPVEALAAKPPGTRASR
jgi:hypothetical protein